MNINYILKEVKPAYKKPFTANIRRRVHPDLFTVKDILSKAEVHDNIYDMYAAIVHKKNTGSTWYCGLLFYDDKDTIIGIVFTRFHNKNFIMGEQFSKLYHSKESYFEAVFPKFILCTRDNYNQYFDYDLGNVSTKYMAENRNCISILDLDGNEYNRDMFEFYYGKKFVTARYGDSVPTLFVGVGDVLTNPVYYLNKVNSLVNKPIKYKKPTLK